MPITLPQNATILFQGDSITDCGRNRTEQDQPNHAPALGAGYPALIARKLLADHLDKNLRIFNRGISGNRIPDLYARIREDLLNLQPQLLSILIGVNDTWHGFVRNAGVPVEKFTRIYRMLLEEIKTELPAIQLILCEPFVLPCGVIQKPWIIEMTQRRAAVKTLAAEFGATFIPFQQMFDDACKLAPPDQWANDGVHPTPAGHELMAQTWLNALSEPAT